jgi:hypothetical protein
MISGVFLEFNSKSISFLVFMQSIPGRLFVCLFVSLALALQHNKAIRAVQSEVVQSLKPRFG